MYPAGSTLKIKKAMTYLFLFLLSLNFMNWFYKTFLVFTIVFLLLQRSISFSRKAALRIGILALFSLVYLLVFFRVKGFEISRLVVYVSFSIMFLFGYLFKTRKQSLQVPFWIITGGLALHGCLNFWTNFAMVSNTVTRWTYDFWTHDEFIMTGQISLFILLAGAFYFSLFRIRLKEHPMAKVCLLLLFVLSFYYYIRTATRTFIYACLLSLIISVLVKKIMIKETSRKIFKVALRQILFPSILVMGILFNLFGVRDWILTWPIMQRNSVLSAIFANDLDERWGQVIAALSQLLAKPWGGYTMIFDKNLEFIHNTWLNIAYRSGVIPSLLFFIYCLTLMSDMMKMINRNVDLNSTLLVSGIYIAMMAYFMLEPVCEAVPYIITMFCFINGMILRQNERNEAEIAAVVDKSCSADAI